MVTKYISTEVEIDLDEFDDDDLLDEIKSRGIGEHFEPVFQHVEHLIVCGLLDEAKKEALDQVSQIIGRKFK